MIQGVILDVDGTLVLSNDAHAQAFVQAFVEHGYDIKFEQVRPLIGMGGDQILPRLVPGLSDEDEVGKAITTRRKQIFSEQLMPTLQAAPGARDLLAEIRRRGLHTVVASSATSEELGVLLKVARVDDLIEATTTSSDAEASKPAPDIVETALGKRNLDPHQAIMIGDTPFDIESASKCGVGVIALRCGDFPDEQLANALAIYDDPADLLAHYDQSPLAR